MNKQHIVRFTDKTIIQHVSESVLPLKYRVYDHTDIYLDVLLTFTLFLRSP